AEGERDAFLLQVRGAMQLILPLSFAILDDAARHALFLLDVAKGQSQHDGCFRRGETIGDLPGITAAKDDRPELELLGEVERPAYLVARVGLEDDRQLAFEALPQRGESRIKRRTLALAAVLFERLPLTLIVL